MEQPLRRKQISIFVHVDDWKEMRIEAARQHIPITELCRRWMRPELEKLQERDAATFRAG